MINRYLVTGFPNQVVLQWQNDYALMSKGDFKAIENAAIADEATWGAGNVFTESLDLVAIGPRGTKPHGNTPL